jgi:PA14 domain
MPKRISLFVAVLLMFVLTSSALAQGPVIQHTSPTWQATYWNNTTLSGTPALVRDEADLNYDWGNGSPDPAVHADGFSARWIRYFDVAPGDYRFTATADDGIRVWVDGDLIINEWYDHPPKTVNAKKHLSAEHHLVTVEFYENAGGAVARVALEPWSAPIQNWRGEYFNNMTLSGASALVRDDANIAFDWGDGSPAPGVVNADLFSVRWTRTLNLPAGSYHFTLTVDDGARLWVNDHLLIDAWRDQAPRTYTGDIYLPGGPTSIKMEYYEHLGGAVARLSWSQGDGPLPGEVIVDDTDAGFVRGGSAGGWHTALEGYGNHLIWTRNNDWARPRYNWARWYPRLSPGMYEVMAFIPERYTTTSNARYWISHAGGYTLRIVDQSANSNRWISLGTYRFNGAANEYVSLNDTTYEPRLTRLVAFDAIKWVPR